MNSKVVNNDKAVEIYFKTCKILESNLSPEAKLIILNWEYGNYDTQQN